MTTAFAMTASQYLAFERTSESLHEFCRGEVRELPPKSLTHCRIQSNLLGGVSGALHDSRWEAFGPNLRLKVTATDFYTYADLLLVCSPLETEDDEDDTLLNPRVIFEILSPSTESYDRGTKFAHYRSLPSLQEYILVAQDQPLIERFTRLPQGTWELREFRGLETRCELTAVPFSVPLSLLYHRVEFPALGLRLVDRESDPR